MNTREKLIELLQDDDCPLLYVFGENIGTLADYLIANGVTFATDDNVPSKWIPVTERLPESKTKILVYGGNELIWVNGVNKPMPSVYTGYMRGLGEGWFTWDEKKYIVNVTHWMPLPEPPKET